LKTINSQRAAYAALTAAFLGWLFDGYEMGLFPLIGQPALQDLMPGASTIIRAQTFSVFIALYLVGAATGGVLFGWLGDKIGRVKAIMLAIFSYAIFTGLCGFTTHLWPFAVLRFVASLGMGGEWSLGVALVNEAWGGRDRRWMAAFIGASSNIGFMITGIFSFKLNGSIDSISHLLLNANIPQTTIDYLTHNRAWRLLAISGALPALVNVFIFSFVKESEGWQEEKKTGRTALWATKDLTGVLIAAIAALVIIYVWSPFCTISHLGALIVSVFAGSISVWGYLLPLRNYLKRLNSGGHVVVDLDKKTLKNLFIGAGLASVVLLGTWGSVQQAARWSSGLVAEGSAIPIMEYTVMASSFGSIVFAFLTPLFADRLGRRVTYAILSASSLCAALVFFKTNTSFQTSFEQYRFITTAFLLGGTTASFYGFFPLYLPELFSTKLRATGQGFCYNFGRLVAAVGTLQLGNLTLFFSGFTHYSLQAFGNAYSVLSLVYLAGIILIWYAPETKGIELA
jgi:MFS family permease